MELAYDGTRFHGWQSQPNAISVQQTVEEALSILLQRKVEITGAGRTDAGVHARKIFAHSDIPEPGDKGRFLSSLNKLVGHDIAVRDLHQVIPDAHARFDAVSRSYSYYISPVKNPFLRKYSWEYTGALDVESMNEGARLLLGTKDFTSFAKLHSDAKTNICTVSEAFWKTESDSGLLRFKITADRFLRNMVRAVVGTLFEIGIGKNPPEHIISVLQEKNRNAAGVSVPAHGLFLENVEYHDEIWI